MQTQLDIFSHKTESLTLAWQRMAAFNFQTAYETITELLQTDRSDSELLQALDVCERWQGKLNSETNPEHLLQFLQQEALPAEWGLRLFRRALIKHIITLADAAGTFRFKDGSTIADLYLLLDDTEKAEQEIGKQIKHSKDSSFLYARLADVQWECEKYSEARANYLLALLFDAENIDVPRLENKIVKFVLEKHGCELAAPWCYISGEPLPVAALVAEEPARFIKHRAFTACVLLAEAERALKTGSPEVGKIRKRLYDLDCRLFEGYKAKITGGRVSQELPLS
jgi:hypothetical protein